MKIESEQKLISATEEHLDIHITFNPANEEEERLAAMIAVTVALVKDYHRLNTLVGE